MRMALMVVGISPIMPTTIKRVPFGFGASKLGVTSGGGGSDTVSVDCQKGRSIQDVVAAAEAITDDVLGTADNEINMKM